MNTVLIDVTSLIGAEEFVLAQNNRRPFGDPFGRQCFVEVVQSLIFMSEVCVAHPVLALPRDTDFGEQPRLLRTLLSRGLVTALRLEESARNSASALEAAALKDLQSADGLSSVVRFVTQARLCDDTVAYGIALATRLREWSQFQET